ncbi:16S rRNA (uracil(1498)-N(3))-methyltransferase [Methylobacterium mesophilicum SR1.6/6]|uniref:Ribosomal RNA small subunit methyltransferase E n=1 Tax=Methylobacterium mesophilicum SR1.6/6 TaxID=908290 RepID=A0A6B9FL44_9HYPH|nr:16S rRNA (uracil(1498)-N(3))-methyltransferase [Methylobacterium mesophilicum]QGY02649.1 16S rRNA (uracil(1498)-N(3))-methyltransferase [Methylobacterium mesophilicum SR1.6/6]
MPAYDFTAPRLFVAADLAAGVTLPLERAQANYLLNVLRKGPDDPVLIFNGRDGEWRAHLVQTGRKGADLHVAARTRPQTPRADLHYLFAPLKSARLDYVAQKAVEMGAGTIRPVITRFTQGDRVNLDRLRANAIEAAEQCGILAIPECPEPERLPRVLTDLAPERLLVFCDEDAPVRDPVRALSAAADPMAPPPLAVLVGPEGGFSEEERALIRARPNTVALSLGPRILRADTAAVTVLALVQAVLGDAR